MRIAILTMSDAGARGEQADTSGDPIAEWAADRFVARAIVPDSSLDIVRHLIGWCEPDALTRGRFAAARRIARANEVLLFANGGQEGNGSGPVRQDPKDTNRDLVTDVHAG